MRWARDTYRLVRLDLIVALKSPWYYVSLLVLAGLVYTWFECEPAGGSTPVQFVDEVGTGRSADIGEHLRRVGLHPQDVARYDDARKAVAKEQAVFAVRVRKDETIEAIVHSPAHMASISRFMRRVVQDQRNKVYRAALKKKGLATVRGRVRTHNLSRTGSRRKGRWAVMAAVKATFLMTQTFAFIAWILTRASFGRIQRKYAAGTIVSSKLIAGMLLGSGFALASYGTTALRGVEYHSLAGVAIVALVTGALATAAGFGCGLMTRVLGGREDRAVVLGLVVIVLGHFILEAASGAIQLGEVGASGQPWTVWNPYFLIQSTLDWLSIYAIPNGLEMASGYLARLAALLASAAVGLYVLITRT